MVFLAGKQYRYGSLIKGENVVEEGMGKGDGLEGSYVGRPGKREWRLIGVAIAST